MRENPGEVGDPGCLEADAGVVGGKTNQGLHELNLPGSGLILEGDSYLLPNISSADGNVQQQNEHFVKSVFSHRVDTGNNLWRELSHDHDNDAGQQAGLQQQGLGIELWQLSSGFSNLYNFWHWEEKAIRCSPVDCCQLGGKEHEADNKDLE